MPRDMGSGRPHVVVIGAGFGGLAAAVRLGAKGYRVTVVEKLDGPGGRAYTFRQDGFTFDAGPTIVTAPYLLEELWALAGRRLQDDVDLRSIDPFYEIRFDDGSLFRASADPDFTRAEVARHAPEDLDGFDRYMRESERIYQVAFEELVDQPFHELSTLIASAPDLVRLGGHFSVYQKVSKFFKNEKLRIAFSFHPLLIGGNPLTATSYYCLISHLERKFGVHYAIGGTGAIVRGLVGLIERQGGRLLYGAEVAQITTSDGRATGVRLQSGVEIAADIVVSNADVGWTYGKLLSHVPRKRWTDQKLDSAGFSMSLVVWYFGTRRRFEDVYHHTMVLGPRYGELLRDIFSRKVLAEDMSLYLHRPTANDPSLAPDGCDAFYVLSPVPNLKSGVDWVAIGESYRQKIQDRLESTVLPGLGEAIVTSRLMTPQDFATRLSSYHGAAFSLAPDLFQSAWFRPHNKSEEVEGLYLVGAGTHPGAGMPGVISSAKVIDRLIPAAVHAG